jgi:hypothetical protein
MQDAAAHHLSSNTGIAATDGNIVPPIIPGTLHGASPAGDGDMKREHGGGVRNRSRTRYPRRPGAAISVTNPLIPTADQCPKSER